MNKTNSQAACALLARQSYAQGSRQVVTDDTPTDHYSEPYVIARYWLYNSCIARLQQHGTELAVSACGWPTRTTLAALNAVLETFGYTERFRVIQGDLYYCDSAGNHRIESDSDMIFDLAED